MKKLSLFLFISVGAFAQVPTISSSSATVQEGQTVTITCNTNCSGLTWKVNGVVGGNSTYGTITGNDTSATYTAPASIVANQEAGGCMIYPNDSLFNTEVDTLPYLSNWHGNSLLNDAYYISWLASKGFQHLSSDDANGTTLNDGTAPVVPFETYYAHYKSNFPLPTWPSEHRENGQYGENSGQDHHVSVIDTTTCTLHELYGDWPDMTQCAGDPNGTTNCHNVISTLENGSLTQYSWSDGTDAAAEPILPLVPRLEEFLKGSINHALRFVFPIGYNPNGSTWTDGKQNKVWPSTAGPTGACGFGVVGLTISSGGSGYSASTTATVVGGYDTNPNDGGSQATVTLTITSGVITGYTITSNGNTYYNNPVSATIQLNNTGGGTGAVITPIIDFPCPPYGGRYVLDPTYLTQHTEATPGVSTSCPAGSNCIDPTSAAYTVAVALKKYGMLDNDNTCCGIFNTYFNADWSLDSTIRASVLNFLSTLTISDFHIIDESQLAINSFGNRTNSQNSEVLPYNNAGLMPPGAIWITATNSSGQSGSPVIAGIAPTIGTPDAEIYIWPGDYSGSKGTGGGYQIPYWVNNSPNGNSVTWSCSTCSANGSSITSGGIYTPPLVESGEPQDVAVATLNSDNNVTEIVRINILPNSGNFTTSAIRIDSGAAGGSKDANNNWWLRDQAYTSDNPGTNSFTWTNYRGTGEQSIYNSYAVPTGQSRYKLIVPNGNYQVRLMAGWASSPASLSATAWNHMPVMVSGTDGGVGVVKGLHWNMMQSAKMPYAQSSNSDFIYGTRVTNNVIETGISNDYPHNNWPTCVNSCSSNSDFDATQSGLQITPDSTPSHWQILATSTPDQNGTPFIDSSVSQSVKPGNSVDLYLQDWYTGLSDPTWTVNGPGTITTTNLQLTANYAFPVAIFTPPSTSVKTDSLSTVKACSQSNPAICATITISIVGNNTGANSNPITVK